jgi:hypothetical protein
MKRNDSFGPGRPLDNTPKRDDTRMTSKKTEAAPVFSAFQGSTQRSGEKPMQDTLPKRWAIICSSILLVLAAPLSAHANCMCGVVWIFAVPCFGAGAILALVIGLLAWRTAGPRVALTVILAVGATLSGIPALLCTGYGVYVAFSCGHTWGWLLLLFFALLVAGVALAGRAVARRAPKATLPR